MEQQAAAARQEAAQAQEEARLAQEKYPRLLGPRGTPNANSATPTGILVRRWEEELRGYLDLTLHTILEESDSEPE